MLYLVRCDLVGDLLQLVGLLEVLELYLVFLVLTHLPVLVLLYLLGEELVDPGLVLLPLPHQLLQHHLLCVLPLYH